MTPNQSGAKKRACVYDKVNALRTDGAVSGNEAEALMQAHRLFCKCEHPGDKPSMDDALRALDKAIQVLESRLLAKQR